MDKFLYDKGYGGLVYQGKHFFGDSFGYRKKTGSVTCGNNDTFHIYKLLEVIGKFKSIMGREDKNINKQYPGGYSSLIKSLFLFLITGILLYGCTGFSPELLSYGEERERIIEDILKRGREFSIRESAEDSLISLLEDPNPQVRMAALRIMESNPSPKIYDAVLTATLDEFEEVSLEAYRILLENWEESRNSVLRGLNSTSASIILTSVTAIGQAESPDDTLYLLTLFSDYREVVRSSASRIYARLGSYENPWFQSLLKHENSLSRLTAVKTLPRFRDPELVPVLMPFILDRDPEIRKAALFGLSEYDTDALPYLHQSLKFSQDDGLRISLLQVVEGISDTASIPVLIGLMDDDNEKISLKSVEILLGMGADQVIPGSDGSVESDE